MKNNKTPTNKDIKRVFDLNNVLSKLMQFIAYIIAVGSAFILIYLSFIDTLDIVIDWKTLSVFSIAAIMLAWINWTAFYKKQYEKMMSTDIQQNEKNQYSIHGRYYNAIKDWDDAALQRKIDEFNKEYITKWLNWVEKKTGCPINTCLEVQLDASGKPILDENGKPKTIEVKGILDRPYKGFKHKFLMWRIKTHHYPESGYKTSMELRSLFSFQDANLNKRELKADKKFYARESISKLLSTILIITMGGSIVPEMVNGDIWTAIIKLVVALSSLVSAVIMGSVTGVRGARLKLSTVEDTCDDLERWADKKPKLEPYKNYELVTEGVADKVVDSNQDNEVTMDIFSSHNLQVK